MLSSSILDRGRNLDLDLVLVLVLGLGLIAIISKKVFIKSPILCTHTHIHTAHIWGFNARAFFPGDNIHTYIDRCERNSEESFFLFFFLWNPSSPRAPARASARLPPRDPKSSAYLTLPTLRFFLSPLCKVHINLSEVGGAPSMQSAKLKTCHAGSIKRRRPRILFSCSLLYPEILLSVSR